MTYARESFHRVSFNYVEYNQRSLKGLHGYDIDSGLCIAITSGVGPFSELHEPQYRVQDTQCRKPRGLYSASHYKVRGLSLSETYTRER